MKRLFPLLILCVFALGALSGCASKSDIVKLPRPSGKIAVAGFTNPVFNWELLAGYLPHEGKPIKKDILQELDAKMVGVLSKHGVTAFARPAITRQCQEIEVFENLGGRREAAFAYWVKVGQCMSADYILVPQILFWQDLRGMQKADFNIQPASVIIDLYLIDVNNRRIIRRFHYDETQQPLTENMLEAGTFFKRGGKWVTAMQLADEALETGLMELGL
ncbi:hypothetical protein [Maridesulfovibrio salexigens]|uniref:Putative lipoprotein n=1 Tax=Maridesulfovibrio salexigens (strain ATCC 14822 / DSM 2638 / NCIMB 8403 / VKM B-1763) TaxID=526222 RepID=C6BSE2_MARSD|nr:hypothetical protein [Maridesulfovibrio salexigens]ACS79618.1 putative lipoprotein [Maridesulfovibrio salexigens DSM 2638]